MAKVIVGSTSAAAKENADGEGLLSCLHAGGVINVTPISSPDFIPLLDFSAQNLRFTEPQILRPYVIIIPENKSQLQQSVVCSINHGWEIRVRSGGHSYEGLSYTACAPFVLIDLQQLNKVTVDTISKTAWVEAGATLGEVYSAIANSSAELGFPAGICHTVGCGGHFAGGGLGLLARKYGLASDHILDALLINYAMDKNSMGEDVFWALRGGGGGNWGIVYAWKIELLSVPPVLTAFKVLKTGADIVTETVHRWQYVAPQTEEDLFIRVELRVKEVKDSRDITASFHGIYLGRKNELLSKIAKIFPELRMESAHCEEMSWIQTVCYFDDIKRCELTNRYYVDKVYFKIKSDFAKVPVPESALRGLWAIMEEEASAYAVFSPLGGMMDRISSSATPFPQRAGTLFDIHYNIKWSDSSKDDYYMEWMRKLYEYMEPYVSRSPRAAYVNFRDLDLGSTCDGQASVEEARVWGEKYFDGNFDRLVKAKTQVDPYNFFRNPQGIPPQRN